MKIFPSFDEPDTGESIPLRDRMPEILAIVSRSGIRTGFVTVTSRQTTTAISISEAGMVAGDKRFLARLVPPGESYLHKDIALTLPRAGRRGYPLSVMLATGGSSSCKR